MSIFDFNSISEAVYKGTIPNPDWVLVPEGEYLAQCTKLEGREVESTRMQQTYLFVELTWEIMDDAVKAACNMEHPSARQSFSLNMTERPPYQLDLGPNQNMALKAVWRACGVTIDPTISKIRHQTAYVRVEHEPMLRDGSQMLDMDGKPQYRATVTRVTSIEAARRTRPNGGA